MKELRDIEMCLISQVQAQCNDLKKVHAAELGEVIDMIKDLEEAIYYCSITKAMEKNNNWDYHMTEMDKKDISRHIYNDSEESPMEEKQMLSNRLQQLAKN